MKIFLSNIPDFILLKELQDCSLKRWIYFGTNSSTLKKIERVLDKQGEQINYGRKLYEVTSVKRKQFIVWIDQIAVCFLGKKEWLFSVPSVKNPCMSNLFLYTCYLFVLENLVKDGERVDLIFVDSPALAVLFKDNFPGLMGMVSINKWLKFGFYFKIFIKLVLRWFKYLLEFGRKFISAKIVLKDRSLRLLRGKKRIIFIRNFITGQFLDTPDDIMERHYFPGLYDYLKSKDYTPVFLSIVTRTSSYRRLYEKVAESGRNIVFPEEFLNLQDYLYAFSVFLRALGLRLPESTFGKYKLGSLLKEEYYTNLTEHGFLYATLLSCLGRRIKECGVTPLGVINWMENQALEKGLIKGFRESFPNIQIIGGQPFFIQENYFSPVSSEQEKKSGLLPEKILVLGPAGRKWATEFIKDVPVEYSPPFRYVSVVSEQVADNQGNSLFVLLTIDFKNAIHVIGTLFKIESQLESFDRIMIKLHPAGHFCKKDLVEALGQNFSDRYEFITGRIEQYIHKAFVGFCGATSTAVELVMSGIPVITMGETYSLTLDFLSCKKDIDMWRLCFSCDDVVEALNHFKKIKKERPQDLIRKAYEFRNFFIAQPSEKYVENYLPEEKK